MYSVCVHVIRCVCFVFVMTAINYATLFVLKTYPLCVRAVLAANVHIIIMNSEDNLVFPFFGRCAVVYLFVM